MRASGQRPYVHGVEWVYRQAIWVTPASASALRRTFSGVWAGCVMLESQTLGLAQPSSPLCDTFLLTVGQPLCANLNLQSSKMCLRSISSDLASLAGFVEGAMQPLHMTATREMQRGA